MAIKIIFSLLEGTLKISYKCLLQIFIIFSTFGDIFEQKHLASAIQGRIKEAWGPGANGDCGAPVPRVFVSAFREIIPTGGCQKKEPPYKRKFLRLCRLMS